MNTLKIQFKNFIWYTVLPVSIFLLFKKGVDIFLKTFLVEPIFSNCYPSSRIYDVATIVIALVIIIPIIFKVMKGVDIPFKWYYIVVTCLTWYLFYRIHNKPFDFTNFSFNNQIKLLDTIAAIPFIIFCCVLVFKMKRQTLQELSNTNGFEVDEAIKIDKNNDLLNRNKFIKEIANKIKNTTSKNGSFPIGVVAAWGAGKTTFLNTLKSEFDNKSFIVIELNVWKCNDTGLIIETLFKLLRQNLKPYSFSIGKELQQYATNLLKESNNEGLKRIVNLSETFLRSPNIEDQYDLINSELKRINKKIIILIDDIDRLDKKEIYEVIRLIRNTANFSNTFFIVAYDRSYILNSIEEINPYQSHLFLEKIFQVEFALPLIDNKILQIQINNRLKLLLSERSKNAYTELLEQNLSAFIRNQVNLTSILIFNIRDVIRFVNSFKLIYEFVKDEVCFHDFYNLELIRYKHPEVFIQIYKNHVLFFTNQMSRNNSIENYHYSLNYKKDENNNNTKISHLEIYLNSQKDIYKLSNTDIQTIVYSFNALFPPSDIPNQTTRRVIDSHLSVTKPSMFNRYFTLGIEGRLSEVQFSKLRALPSNEFNTKITDLLKDETLIQDIAERFEETNEFDSKEDFEKVVRAIFHFANLPNPKQETGVKDFIRYNGRKLSNVLGSNHSLKYYENNKEEIKKFLLPLLETDNIKYTYTNEFVSSLLHDGYYQLNGIFLPEEISKIIFNNFYNALKNSEKLTLNLWFHFQSCEVRSENPTGYNVSTISYSISANAKKLLRRFILENDIDRFIRYVIDSAPTFDKRYTIGGSIKLVFKKNEIFIWLLKRYNSVSKYKEEFLNFYEALLTNEEYRQLGVPLNFFKVIPVESGFDD